MNKADLQNLSNAEIKELVAEHKAKLLAIRVARGLNKEFKSHEVSLQEGDSKTANLHE